MLSWQVLEQHRSQQAFDYRHSFAHNIFVEAARENGADDWWSGGDRISDELRLDNRISGGAVHNWTLLEEMRFTTAYLKTQQTKPKLQAVVAVPRGSDTDFASIPRPLWWIAAPWGRHGRAGIVHDYAYRTGRIDLIDRDGSVQEVPIARTEADFLFFSAMFILDKKYNEAQDVNPTRSGVTGAIGRRLLRMTLPVVRLSMSLAVIGFGWFSYKGSTKSRSSVGAGVATAAAVAGLVALGWWLLGRFFQGLFSVPQTYAAGWIGVACVGIALASTRGTVEWAKRTLQARLLEHAKGPIRRT